MLKDILSMRMRIIHSIFYAFPVLIGLYVIRNTSYTESGIVRPSLQLIIVLYFLVYLILIGIEIYKVNHYRRAIASLNCDKIYSSKLVVRTIGWLILILSVFMYLILMMTRVIDLMILSYVMSFIAIVFIQDRSIYRKNNTLIVDGAVYNLGEIISWNDGEFYRIYINSNSKKKYISCKTPKRYDFVKSLFDSNLGSLKLP